MATTDSASANTPIDVWAFRFAGRSYIDSRALHFSVGLMEQKFCDAMVERELAQYPEDSRTPTLRQTIERRIMGTYEMETDEMGHSYMARKGGLLEDAVHLLFDRGSHRLYVVGEKTVSGNANRDAVLSARERLLGDVASWLKRKYGEEVSDTVVGSKSVPYRDYEVYTVGDFPSVPALLDSIGASVQVPQRLPVVVVDYSAESFKNAVAMAANVSVEDLPTLPGALWAERPFYLSEGASFMLHPPFILVNGRDANPISVSWEVASVLVNRFDVKRDVNEYVRDRLRMKRYRNFDLGSLMYNDFAEIAKSNGNVFGEILSEQTRAIAERCHLTPETDGPLLDLLEAMRFYAIAFPVSDPRNYEQIYYYVASKGAVEHEDVFRMFCAPSGSSQDGKTVYASRFCLPPEMMALFQIDVAAMYAYNIRNTTLSGQLDFVVDHGGSIETTPSALAIVRRDLHNRVGEFEDRSRETVMMMALSAFPAAYGEVSEMFRQYGLKYTDIKVILVSDPDEPGMFGGYFPKQGRRNSEAVALARDCQPFQPPFIIFNLLNSKAGDYSVLVQTLVHEASHYVDDLRIEQGMASSDILFRPEMPRSNEIQERRRYWEEYLGKSETEKRAHAREIFMMLKLLSPEYVKANRDRLRNDWIRRFFMSSSQGGQNALEEVQTELYSNIFDEAYTAYEKWLQEQSPSAE